MLKKEFAALTARIPDMMLIRSGSLLQTEPPQDLATLGLADERGLTRKGNKALDLLLELAAVMDVHYA